MNRGHGTMSNNNFQSLLSEFHDATAKVSSGALASGTGAINKNPSSLDPFTISSCSEANTNSNSMDPTNTTDPSFSAPILKERVERMIRIRQIRKSTCGNKKIGDDDDDNDDHVSTHNKQQNIHNASSVHIAICATIVDDFPHEALWKKWMDQTGGEFSLDDGDDGVLQRSGENIVASAEMYVHAKNPERIQSEWLRSKILPITHRPNWNDVRIVRAILSLLETALRDRKTTHVLLCTESCIPIATLTETAKSVLLNEVCHWEEEGQGNDNGHDSKVSLTNHAQKSCSNNKQRRLHWNQSYVNCYDRNSSRCTRFDEHNCWGILQESLPEEVVHKALPGWCLLSRKHADDIVNIPLQLAGMSLWPAFERVWAPEEVFLPTALAVCGNMEEVSRRALTYCHWDTRASNQKDRAHPITYDGYFDDLLVCRARAEGCLFLRKMKRPINTSVWEQIVVRHRKGRDDARMSIDSSEQGMGRGDRIGYSNTREVRRSPNDRTAYDSRRSHNSTNQQEYHNQRRKRELGSHPNYNDSRKRSSWRR